MQSGSSLNMSSSLHLIPGESFEVTSGVCNLCLVESFLIRILALVLQPCEVMLKCVGLLLCSALIQVTTVCFV